MFELNQVIKLFSCSTQLNVEFIMLMNVEMTMVKTVETGQTCWLF